MFNIAVGSVRFVLNITDFELSAADVILLVSMADLALSLADDDDGLEEREPDALFLACDVGDEGLVKLVDIFLEAAIEDNGLLIVAAGILITNDNATVHCQVV